MPSDSFDALHAASMTRVARMILGNVGVWIWTSSDTRSMAVAWDEIYERLTREVNAKRPETFAFPDSWAQVPSSLESALDI